MTQENNPLTTENTGSPPPCPTQGEEDNVRPLNSIPPPCPPHREEKTAEVEIDKKKSFRRRFFKMVAVLTAFHGAIAILLLACVFVPMMFKTKHQEPPSAIVSIPFNSEEIAKQVLGLPWSWVLQTCSNGNPARLELRIEGLQKAYPANQSIIVRVTGRFFQTKDRTIFETPVSMLLRLPLFLENDCILVGHPLVESITGTNSEESQESSTATLSIHLNQIEAGLDDHVDGYKLAIPDSTTDIRGLDREFIFLNVSR